MKSSSVQICTIFLLVLISVISFPENLKAQSRQKKKKHKKEVVDVNKAPHSKYKNLPKVGTTVKTTPKGAVMVHPGNVKYYYYGGLFYKPYAGSYIVVKAPRGTRVKVLPANRSLIVVEGQNYYYYYGTYYYADSLNNDYVITAPPKSAVVDAIPEGYEIKMIDDKEYFIYDDTWYKTVEMKNGETGYEVVNED